MSPTITFFPKEYGKHQQAIEQIAMEAENRGFDVEFRPDDYRKTDIGVFASSAAFHHPRCHTDLSVVLFHGIDSAYSSGARRKNWSKFDIGLLPGPAAAEYWRKDSAYPSSRPKIGAFEVGWPKADWIFTDEFANAVREYRTDLALSENVSILYAPTFETGNMSEFVSQLEKTNCNLLVKHGSYDTGDRMGTSLDELYNEYEATESVSILDGGTNIFLPLAVADVVVSDSLSVLLEGLLTETLPVAITDWETKSGESWGYEKPEFVMTHAGSELDQLIENIESIEQAYEWGSHVQDHFINVGTSSKVVLELIERVYEGRALPLEPLTPVDNDTMTYRRLAVQNTLRNTYLSAVGLGRSRLTKRQERILKKMKVDKLVRTLDRTLSRGK